MLRVASTQKENDTRQLLSQTKFYNDYSRWREEDERYETWDEAVTRVMDMHREKYKDKMSDELSLLIDEAESLYKLQYALGAQRALQFGGEQILKNNMKMYNCTSTYSDRAEYFNEQFWVLLCGAGEGFSVQKQHIAKIPNIKERKKQAKGYVVEDSIEGWADALGVLMSSYLEGGGAFPEFEGRKVYFDLSHIRPKGAKISGGFKAPGPEPLRRALDKIEYLIQGLVLKGETRLRPIDVYDITMFAADAVLSGGVRRSATICLFSADDEEMLTAKTGNWLEENPQRARSNNSAVIDRNKISRERFHDIIDHIRDYGEPGFFFVDDLEFTTNPCVEIGMLPQIDGKSGWQGCNLTEINGGKCINKEEFFKACRAASILGTLQAGYTDFHYLTDTTKEIFEREALLGCSITGWMTNPDVLLDADIQREGAEIIKRVNEQVAKLIDINPAARTTCVKPSGNASVLLQTSSGIHAEHSPRYLRNVQLNKEGEVAQLLADTNPYMVEESVWSEGKTDYVVSFPVISREGSIYKEELYGTKLLEKVKLVQQNWVEAGTNVDRCTHPKLRHNVSNTVTVRWNQWKEVGDYLYDNRQYFAGVSFLSGTGDKDFAQAPFTEVLTEEQIVDKYGRAALFGSGLIVDAHTGFSSLWEACQLASLPETHRGEGEVEDIRNEWVRRFHKFAENYFGGDLRMTEYCLKDLTLLHRWTKIQQNFKEVNFVNQLEVKKYTDVDTLGSVACAGGVCDISLDL